MTDPASYSIRHAAQPARHIVVMGVSGSGKTTLGRMLATEFGLPMAEADEFHPPENIAKMTAGTPLEDSDRWPWLDALRTWMDGHAAHGSLVTCSALRRSYRDVLRAADGETLFLHVVVEAPRLRDRLRHRSGHFMPPALMASQLAALEPLEADEAGVELVNDTTEQNLLEAARAWLDAGSRTSGSGKGKNHGT